MFLAQSTIRSPFKVTIRYREDIPRSPPTVEDWLADVQVHRASSIRIVSAPGAEILNSEAQLNALCYEVARNGSASLCIDICTSVPSMCILLDTFSGLFGNNRNLALDVSRSRLNHHGDIWVPHLMNFLRETPSLRFLNLGYVTTIHCRLESSRNSRKLPSSKNYDMFDEDALCRQHAPNPNTNTATDDASCMTYAVSEAYCIFQPHVGLVCIVSSI
jgi:hypothetical protein